MRLLTLVVVVVVAVLAQLWAADAGAVVNSKSNASLSDFITLSPARRVQEKNILKERYSALVLVFSMLRDYVTLTSSDLVEVLMKEAERVDRKGTNLLNGYVAAITKTSTSLWVPISQAKSRSRTSSRLDALVKEAKVLGYHINDVRNLRKRIRKYWCPDGWTVVDRRYCFRIIKYVIGKQTSVARLCGNQLGHAFAPRSLAEVTAVGKQLRKNSGEFWVDVSGLCRSGQVNANISNRVCGPNRCAVMSRGELKPSACSGTRKIVCQRPPLSPAVDMRD